MKECVNCKAILEDDELFCHECGTKQEIEKKEDLAEETQEPQGKKCIHCGETIDDDSLFCPYCGKQQNEPSSDAIKEEDKISEEDKNAQNFKEALKEEEKLDQEPSDNNQVEESKTEEDYSRLKKWLYIVLFFLVLFVFAFYYIRNNNSIQEAENDSSQEMIDKKAPISSLEYTVFLDIFKDLNPEVYMSELLYPSHEIDKYKLDFHQYEDGNSDGFILGRNIKYSGKDVVPTDKGAWCFIAYHIEDEGGELSLKFFDQHDHKKFIEQAYKYGLVRIKNNGFENEEDIDKNIFAASKAVKGKITTIDNSVDTLLKYGVIGPFIIQKDRIKLSF